MRTEVITVTPATPYEEAAKIMHQHNFSGLPVVEADGKLVGIVSEKDLFRALYPEVSVYLKEPDAYRDQESRESEIEKIRRRPVAEFMQTNLMTAEPDTPILKAGGVMLAYGVHRLPVVQNGKLVGLVTREEIYGAILKDHLGF